MAVMDAPVYRQRNAAAEGMRICRWREEEEYVTYGNAPRARARQTKRRATVVVGRRYGRDKTGSRREGQKVW